MNFFIPDRFKSIKSCKCLCKSDHQIFIFQNTYFINIQINRMKCNGRNRFIRISIDPRVRGHGFVQRKQLDQL